MVLVQIFLVLPITGQDQAVIFVYTSIFFLFCFDSKIIFWLQQNSPCWYYHLWMSIYCQNTIKYSREKLFLISLNDQLAYRIFSFLIVEIFCRLFDLKVKSADNFRLEWREMTRKELDFKYGTHTSLIEECW